MIISIKSKIENLTNSKLIERYPVLASIEKEIVSAINNLIEVSTMAEVNHYGKWWLIC